MEEGKSDKDGSSEIEKFKDHEEVGSFEKGGDVEKVVDSVKSGEDGFDSLEEAPGVLEPVVKVEDGKSDYGVDSFEKAPVETPVETSVEIPVEIPIETPKIEDNKTIDDIDSVKEAPVPASSSKA